MPSTPYAASAAATPIASAKRPKRRGNPAVSLASPVRRAALGGDNTNTNAIANAGVKGKSNATKTEDAAATGVGEGSSGAPGGDGVWSGSTTDKTTTPVGKRSDEGSQGGDAMQAGPEAPSPTKARKGSSAATPRSSGSCTNSGRQQLEHKHQEQGKGGSAEGVVKGQWKASEGGQDQYRHKPKESSIFSPALNHSQEEARDDQAPASTVGAAAEKHARADDYVAFSATTEVAASLSSTAAAEPSAKRGRTSCSSQEGEGVMATAVDAAAIATAKERRPGGGGGGGGDGGGVERVEDEGGSEEDDDAPPGLAIREIGDVVAEVVGVVEEEEGEEEEEFNPYCFIAHLPPYNTVKHHTPEAPALPEKRSTRNGKELTLVLDLDETLVHCTVDPIDDPDHRFEVHFNGEEFQVYVRKRPHLDAFLEAVSELFEVVVFTASQQVYAERLLNMIDPQKKFVKYRLYRDACMALEGNYLKDLNVLGRDLSKVAIVDNSPYAYGFQIDNGIPIESWFDDRNDEELLHLLPLLKQLISESETAGGDVRPFIRNIFKTHELVDKARNGGRDSGDPVHYPALTPAVKEAEKDNKREEVNEAGVATAGGEAGSPSG